MTRVIAATSTFEGPAIQWFKISPILALLGGALFLILVGSLTPQWKRGWYATASVVTAVTAAVLTGVLWNQMGDDKPSTLVGGALAFDHFALFATFTICLSVALASLVVNDYLTREGEDGPEVYGLILAAAIGGVVMVSANDLLVLFLGLETLSLSFYLLTASSRSRTQSGEAGLKYFILGAFSSAFFLFGAALIYAATSSVNFSTVAVAMENSSQDGLIIPGIGMIAVGLLFKVGAVPFHQWVPDVYQGSPTPLTAFMSAATKVAAFGALLRVFYVAFGGMRWDWRPMMWVIAVLSMVIGSLLAVTQTDMKRMLAFSSVAHTGFILLGVISTSATGLSSTLFYLLAYGFTSVGVFAIVGLVRDASGEATHLSQWAGLGKKSPWMASIFALFLLALAGIPLTSGFTGKFAVFTAAVDGGATPLVIVAVVASAIAAFFYARVIVLMFFTEPPVDGPSVIVPSPFTTVAIGICAAFTLLLGIVPQPVLELVINAGLFLR